MTRRLLQPVRIAAFAAALAVCAASPAQETPANVPPIERAPGVPDPKVRGLDVREHLGAPLPMELRFVNAEGKTIRLGDYFTHTGPDGETVQGKPAIIAMVYYSCGNVCQATLRTINECVSDNEQFANLTVGKDFNVLVVPFDHNRDTVQIAAHEKQEALLAYGRENIPQVKDGWAFHAADKIGSKALADALGFQYRELENGEFSHPVAFFVATPDGTISRYCYGFAHTPFQLKLAVLEAAQGTISKSLKDRFLTYCYMYDPSVGAYTLRAMRVMQVGAGVCAVGLGGLVGMLLLGERMRKKRMKQAISVGGTGAPAV